MSDDRRNEGEDEERDRKCLEIECSSTRLSTEYELISSWYK